MVLARPGVPSEAHIGQQVQEILVESSVVVDVDEFMGKHFACSPHEDAVAGVRLAVVVEASVLVVEAQSSLHGPLSPVVGALVVERSAPIGAGEVAAEQERAGVPRDGVLGDGIVGVLLDQLCNAVVVESHWGIHPVTAEETAGAHEPVIARGLLVAASDKILSHGVFAARLGQGEIVANGEILVQRHVVIQILVAGDAGQGEAVKGLAHGQAVGHRGAAIETGVIVGDVTGLDPLIGVASLKAYRHRGHIGEVPPVMVAPFDLGTATELAFPVAAAAVVAVGEFAFGGIVLG